MKSRNRAREGSRQARSGSFQHGQLGAHRRLIIGRGERLRDVMRRKWKPRRLPAGKFLLRACAANSGINNMLRAKISRLLSRRPHGVRGIMVAIDGGAGGVRDRRCRSMENVAPWQPEQGK